MPGKTLPPPPTKALPPPPPRPNTAANREPYLDFLKRIPAREVRKADRRWRTSHRRMLRHSLALYASEILRGPPEYGGRFLLGPHHLEWSDAVSEEERILALAARDHGKSHFWTFAYPLWMIDVVAPGKVGYIFSASRELAENHLEKIRMEIVGGGENGGPNPKLAHLLPFKKDSKGVIKFANNSEIRARGFGSKARGGHPWWVVGDDMGNDEWIWSELVREKAIDYFLSAIRPMVVPGGQLIVVGTPFHARDLYQYLDDTGVYSVLKHPALNPRTGAALWPERYDIEALERTRKELGSELRFSREYLCRPISDDSSLFPPWLFDLPGVKRPYTCGLKDFWEQEGMMVYAGVDLAMSASTGADYMVIFVMAVDPQGNRWVVDIVRRKGLGYQEQVDLVVRVAKRYDCQLVFVEANQYQRVISDMIVTQSDVPIRAFYTTGKDVSSATNERRGMKGSIAQNKNSLDRGVPALRMLLENQKLRIPWAKATREVIAQWIGEMTSFGWANGKLQGVGAHDDTVMAMWMADQAAQKGQKFVPGFLEKADEERVAKLVPNYWEEDEPKPEDRPKQQQRPPKNPAANRGKERDPDWFGLDTDLIGLGAEDGEEDWIDIGA